MVCEELTIEASHKCNLKCVHCSSSFDDHYLPFEQIKELVERIKPKTIRWSGGEPYYYLEKKYLELEDNKIDHIVSTNGTFKEKMLELLDFTDKIRISIYGDENTHDTVTAIKGSYQKAYESVKLLKDMNFDIVITSPYWNDSQLLEVIGISDELDVDVRISALVPNTEIVRGNTCSTGVGECKYDEKLLVLPDGKILHCAVEKRGGECKFFKRNEVSVLRKKFRSKMIDIFGTTSKDDLAKWDEFIDADITKENIDKCTEMNVVNVGE